MPETLTAEEIRDVRAMLGERPKVQAALKMGTADQPSRDGHAHRDNVIREQGSGAPTHVAKEGTLYWDKASKVQYVNSGGSTAWAEQSAGGVAGNHTLVSTTHTDVAGTVSNAYLLQYSSSLSKWGPQTPDSHAPFGHHTPALARAAVPFQNYIPFGAVDGGQPTTPQ